MTDKPKRRKEDLLKEAQQNQNAFRSLYTEPQIVENEDGKYKTVHKISWKKILSSSIFGFILAWAIWCTSTIYSYETRISIIDEQMITVINSLSDEISERKNDRTVLHKRITKVDDFSRDQIRMLQKAIHDYRMATFDKVDRTKETLVDMMIRILENQEEMGAIEVNK